MKDMKHIWKYSCSILCSLAILVYVTSCTDLNEEVFSEITEDTYEYSPGDASRLLASVYADLRYYIGFYTYYIQEICTDEMVQPANAAGWDDGGVYRRMHLHTWNAEQTHVIDHWATTYTGILLANRAIHLLSEEGFPFSPTENKESMLAETRALRAYYYWNALDNYGDVALVTEPTDEFPDKTSRKEVYDFVVKELLECMNDLPEVKSTANYGRFTKWAAKALLANVYLNAEVYTGTPPNGRLVSLSATTSSTATSTSWTAIIWTRSKFITKTPWKIFSLFLLIMSMLRDLRSIKPVCMRQTRTRTSYRTVPGDPAPTKQCLSL